MNVRKRRVLLLGLTGLLVCGAVWRRAKSEPALASPASTQAGTRSASLEFGGRTRTYLVHVPAGHDSKTPLPLVFVLHGATQSAESAERMSGMSPKADQNHFIAVYPSGTGRLSGVPTWNAGNCCGYALANRIDDIGFFRALIENSNAITRSTPSASTSPVSPTARSCPIGWPAKCPIKSRPSHQ
jgi:polyhydroxybutyrate depolymerase